MGPDTTPNAESLPPESGRAPRNSRFGAIATTTGLVLTLVATLVASGAAAWTALTTQQAYNSSQATLLLERRLSACMELREAASSQISVALKIVQTGADPAATLQLSDDGTTLSGSMLELGVSGFDYYGYYGGEYWGDNWVGCADVSVVDATQCKRQLKEKYDALRRLLERRINLRNYALSEEARLRVEGAQTFVLIGPEPLANAERSLRASLDELSQLGGDYDAITKEGDTTLDDALHSLEAFKQQCQKSVGL